MNEKQSEVIHKDRRGRMRLTVIRRHGHYGPRYCALIYRRFKKSEGENGSPIWEETHWLDEQAVLNSKRLHEVADDIIATANHQNAAQRSSEAS